MKKEFTTLGQYFKNLGSQVMRSDTSSESNAVSDEKPSLKNRLAKHLVAGAAAVAIAGSANAAVVDWNCNLVIPNSIDGLYINVESQVYGSAAGNVAGWDLNPYGTSTTTMSWFGAGAQTGCVTGLGQGGTTIAVASLSLGTVIGSANTYGNTASSVTAGGWVLNANNYFGFRFFAADGLTHYGYGKMLVGATMGVRTLVSLSFESTAATSITIPGAACTAPTLSATTVAAICAGDANGSINLTTTGGSPTPLIYAWSNGGSTEDLSGLTAGTYSVTVTTPTGGCSATGSYAVAAGAPNVTYYADADGDGYGAGTATNACPQPAGYVINNLDCNDVNSAISPTTIWYLDVDADGSYVSTYMSCTSPGANYNTTGGIVGDCNDNNPLIRPGVTETCNSIDDDCDALIDENSSNTY